MKLRTLKLISISWALLIIFSCLTINIYFPEAEVKKTAEEIVGEIRKTDEDKEKKDKNSQEKIGEQVESAQKAFFALIPTVFAQQEKEVSTPKIRALKQSMIQRLPKLTPFYEGGNIGETNEGLIEIREDAALSLKDKATLRSLEKEENNDRMSLYAEVAKAMDIDASQISRIQKIFAQEWIKNARSGWWIQKENGQWVKK